MGQENLRPGLAPPLFGIGGYKNSGKTTLIAALIGELVSRGWRVGTIKHAHHDFDVDHPGKDSYLHRAAGASEVVLVSDRRVAHLRELKGADPPDLQALARGMGSVDLVLVEGWKSGTHPRLELRRVAVPAPPLAGHFPGVLLIVSEAVLEGEPVPVLDRANVPAIADFLLKALSLPPRRKIGPGQSSG